MKDKNEVFRQKVFKVHGDFVDTSKANYEKSNKKVLLICKRKDKFGVEHGEYWQTPSQCLRGSKCPKCTSENRGIKKEDRMDTEKYIQEERKVHGDRYGVEKVDYIDANTKICLVCKEHGEFWQLPYAHLQGQGCPKCAGIGLTRDEMIAKFNKIHDGKYSYDKFDYKGSSIKSKITCPIHGDFLQSPSKHLAGQGCPKCACENRNNGVKIMINGVIDRANKIHNGFYSYVPKEINSLHDKIEIICPKHGTFRQIAYDHLNGHGCPRCGIMSSSGEDEIYHYLKDELGIDNVVRRCRDIIPPMEIDIYLPKYKIGIEYNGLIWHSEKFKTDKNYHLNKLNRCTDKGIKLIQIFEDEFDEKREIVLEKLKHIIGLSDKPKLYGRKCKIAEIDRDTAKGFIDKYHIQGFVNSSVYIGAYKGVDLVGAMTFTTVGKDGLFTLTRCATTDEYDCVGICGKMLNYFISSYIRSK